MLNIQIITNFQPVIFFLALNASNQDKNKDYKYFVYQNSFFGCKFWHYDLKSIQSLEVVKVVSCSAIFLLWAPILHPTPSGARVNVDYQ